MALGEEVGFGPAAGAFAPLVEFCRTVDRVLIERGRGEEAALPVAYALENLLAKNDWLTGIWRHADPKSYQQHPLYIDPVARFSVVSFVWSPEQSTPIHDHGVWGVVGVLCGAERRQRYRRLRGGELEPQGPARLLKPGTIDVLLPSQGDIHSVANALEEEVTVSIHVYGADIGKLPRRWYDNSGAEHEFVSRYSSASQAIGRGQVGAR